MDWEKLWKDHWKELYNFIYFKMSSGRQEAEDLTQETFIRLMRSKRNYESSNVVAVLKRTALRLIIDRWRKMRKQGQSLPIFEEILADKGMYDPEQMVIRDELIRQALKALNDEQRMIVVLRVIQGYSVKETAEITGKAESSVKTMQFRAIRMIQKKLGINNEEGEPGHGTE
ncbi:RNA polymerase sigma-70 factor (ECF subfamily) [Paenibacillus taihuensis]|uniref:RNA polymerase sigma-70 factor (ECF subfamily) n=1 Tax=Paenibacillus taihuensis TaxID=1156355 RepID=A0A3D9RHB6_9BACL|nr:sigma-70 family RNA polymerase sigma factor [Paenibacillus taihuensis]REE77737.1 RNA polymerase sigma-70 factor (ECF subfamily) [Paenibacillus taihuensis]